MTFHRIQICGALCAFAFILCCGQPAARAHSFSLAAAAQPQDSAAQNQSGQHDFDFEIGSWNIHLKRLVHPLTGSNEWVEFDGTSVTKKVWDGRSQLEEFETNSAAGGKIEGLTLRLFNPNTRQWSLYWATSSSSRMFPPQVGEFKNGRGEFYGQDTANGKPVFVKFVWTNTNTGTPHFEQSFSDDGGKTWEINWITDQTRVPEGSINAQNQHDPGAAKSTARQSAQDGPHGFDFFFGSWNQHLKRLDHPLTGSHSWIEFDGAITDRKVWDGRANLDEFEAEGPSGHIEGLTLRLFDPHTRQWSLFWANSTAADLTGPPNVGEFKNGRGEFICQDTLNGRAILVRYEWTNTNTNSPHFEQSYSDNGGKTWEVNWISSMSRPQSN